MWTHIVFVYLILSLCVQYLNEFFRHVHDNYISYLNVIFKITLFTKVVVFFLELKRTKQKSINIDNMLHVWLKFFQNWSFGNLSKRNSWNFLVKMYNQCDYNHQLRMSSLKIGPVPWKLWKLKRKGKKGVEPKYIRCKALRSLVDSILSTKHLPEDLFSRNTFLARLKTFQTWQVILI